MNTGPRDRTVYISKQTKQRLFWIRQVEQDKLPEGKILTTDEIADRLLNAQIEAVYPNIKTLEKRLNTLEDQLVSELLSPTVEKS